MLTQVTFIRRDLSNPIVEVGSGNLKDYIQQLLNSHLFDGPEFQVDISEEGMTVVSYGAFTTITEICDDCGKKLLKNPKVLALTT